MSTHAKNLANFSVHPIAYNKFAIFTVMIAACFNNGLYGLFMGWVVPEYIALNLINIIKITIIADPAGIATVPTPAAWLL
jgi:hypothetical protein